ncbi:MAG: NAD(P)-dependent oxidoreductase [Halothiobacillus sp.]|jgi:3-hydroxyisobutyrate dehydrogenase|uniref:NAD(P)-dependent oxidoreductase n=1 Tax=Halothiobacillus sp. TaxID=1891311 RepID=UPI002AD3D361|nr:NAD(P)-dependent oxidoreductase [Halothiobacillus sp.]MDA3875555.1 NAD(P)-dependent oxidoreductase [Halothiobacillus sp.]
MHTDSIAVLGLGLMGRAIARRLAEQGFRVSGYNRSPLDDPDLVKAEISVTQDLAAAVQETPIIWIMLSDFAACESILLSESAASLWQNRLIINAATIAPDESRTLAAAVRNLGGRYLEAPVLGSTPQAISGGLQILLGGDPADIDTATPILSALGTPAHFGFVGQGAAAKLAMNQLIGSLTAAFSMSLGLIQRESVSVETFMTTLRQSALYAPTFDKKLDRMTDRNFTEANFPLKHLLKDIRLFKTAADPQGIDTRLIDSLADVLEQGVRSGHADDDYCALFDTIVRAE